MRSGAAGRAVAMGAVALAATFGMTACGSAGPTTSKADVVAKLKTEKDTKGLPDKAVNCLADVLIKHGNKSDVRKYVDGKKKIDDIRQTSGTNKGIQKELETCVK